MLEDWVDDAEVELARPHPEGASAAEQAPFDGLRVASAADTAPGTRRGSRLRRGAWFALLAVGLAVVGMDEIPEWVPTVLPFGIDEALEAGAWATLFTGPDEKAARDEDPPSYSPARVDEGAGQFEDEIFSGENVLPRDAWHAAPILASTDSLGTPWRITVHHSGGRVVTTDDARGTARLLRAIQRDHQERRRWADIAYHYIVDRAGRVWEGRSSRWVGAHAGSGGANEGNLGILVLGNFDEQSPPPTQVRALTRLIDALERRYRMAPGSVFTHAEVRESHGMATTDCPGRDLTGWIRAYRRGGAERLEARDRIGD